MNQNQNSNSAAGAVAPAATCSASFNAWLFVMLNMTFQMGFLVNAVIWRIDAGETENIGYPAGILVAVAISWGLLLIRRPNSQDQVRPAVTCIDLFD